MSGRFIVQPVEGYTINVERGAPGNTRRAPTCSFSILDTAFNYAVVAEFNTGSESYGGEATNRRKAHAYCAELNAWADLHGTEPVPEFEG